MAWPAVRGRVVKRQITITHDLRAAASECIEAIVPTCYLHTPSGDVARVIDGQLVTAARDTLDVWIHEMAEGVSPRHDTHAPMLISLRIIRMARALALLPDSPLRRLDRVTTDPYVDSAGAVVSHLGYHDGVVLVDSPTREEVASLIPATPTADDVRACLDLFADLLEGVPLVAGADRAAWLCLILGQVMRRRYAGPSPLGLVQANVQGAGKTTLARTAGIIAANCADVGGYDADETEWTRQILGILRRPPSQYVIDNVDRPIGGRVLDSLLTSDTYSGRLLGASEVIIVPNRVQWIITANSTLVGRDLADRTLPIRLRSASENPRRLTTWRHPDLAIARDRRPAYLAAVLTIVRAWEQAGRPAQDVPAWGSYQGWSRAVRECVVWAGWPDPCGTRDGLELQIADHDEHLDLLDAVEALARNGPVRSSDVAARLGVPVASIGTRLGLLADRPLGGRRLVRTRGARGRNLWTVADDNQIHVVRDAEI